MTCSIRPASWALCGLLAAALALSRPVAAAEIREVQPDPDGSGGGLMLVGEIVEGDHDALARAIRDGGPGLGRLYLASPGGKVHEAMRIGRLVRRLRWATAAPPDDARGPWRDLDPDSMICASACFFVYAAGIERSGGNLGIHRPYLDRNEYRAVAQAEAEHDYRSSRARFSKYLEEMDVPRFLIELTFMTPSDDMYWVEPEDAESFLGGYTASLQNWVEAQCETLDWRVTARRQRLDERRMAGEVLSAEDDYTLRDLEETLSRQRACRTAFVKEIRQEAWVRQFDNGSGALVDSEEGSPQTTKSAIP